MSEEGKIVHHHRQSDQPSAAQYGTFEGCASQAAMGFPHPAPPRGAFDSPSQGYQAVPGYVVAEGTPVREPRLPCCGIGFGWFLFIIGFFLVGIPWYVGAIVLICCRNVDRREKPGYIGCTIAAVLAIIAIIFGVTRIYD